MAKSRESQRSGLNRRPLDYESSALPLSYAGDRLCRFNALARTRTATPCGTTPSRWRVYQFHHQGNPYQLSAFSKLEYENTIPIHRVKPELSNTGATGLEPATSRVTVECSNQTELRPQKNSYQLPATSYLLPATCHQQTTCTARPSSSALCHLLLDPLIPLAIAPRGIEPLSAP